MTIRADDRQIRKARLGATIQLRYWSGMVALSETLPQRAIPLCEIESTYLAGKSTRGVEHLLLLLARQRWASFTSLVYRSQ
jgi:hypothetical protein